MQRSGGYVLFVMSTDHVFRHGLALRRFTSWQMSYVKKRNAFTCWVDNESGIRKQSSKMKLDNIRLLMESQYKEYEMREEKNIHELRRLHGRILMKARR